MIVTYHGGKMQKPKRVRQGRVWYGHGLYLTTSLEVARSYALGGGRRVWEVTLAPVAWADQLIVDPYEAEITLEVLPKAIYRRALPRVRAFAERAPVLYAEAVLNTVYNVLTDDGDTVITPGQAKSLWGLGQALGVQAVVEDYGRTAVLLDDRAILRAAVVPARAQGSDRYPWELPSIYAQRSL